jgi:16S rRNA (guanine527-N7)-methyltransferase
VADGFKLERDRSQVERLAQAFRVSLLPNAVDTLGRYVELVATWNRKLDLTAAKQTQALVEVLLADAFILAAEDLVPTRSRCIDVGSGAGSPAIPLALMRGDLQLTLVEPLRKRVAFLRTVVGTLQLVTRVRVIEQKIEPESVAEPEEAFDVAMSRATFAPEVWLPVGVKLAPRTLVLLAQQTPPSAAGATLDRLVSYTLPSNGAERKVGIYTRAGAA